MKTHRCSFLFSAGALLFSVAASSAFGQIIVPVVPQVIPQQTARVQAVFSPGQAQVGTKNFADLEVVLTKWKDGNGVSDLTKGDFHVYFGGYSSEHGCASEDAMVVESASGNGGIYILHIGFPDRCFGWIASGSYLAEVRVDSPATGFTGQTVARLDVP